MLDPKTMTPEQAQQARAQAFYLLKKFTSYTFLDKARALYQGYLDAYERLLNNPVYPRKRIWYKEFLSFMIPIEEGLRLLRHTPHKVEAYRQFEGCTRPISSALFGRSAHEIGISYEPFFQSLGMAEEDSGKPDEGVIKDVWDSLSIFSYFRLTVFSRLPSKADSLDGTFGYNYESMIEDIYFKPLPRYKRPFRPYIYPFNFPTPLPPCPPRNTNKEGQVWSGEEIPITGIYEPWFIGGQHVGCPNYFLAGQEAIEYQMEGTQDKEQVAWRLIWEDQRYLDGNIPQEEAHYLREPNESSSAQQTPVLSALPGQPCPKAGIWFAPHLQMKEVRMQHGEPMPGGAVGGSGGVTWYFKG